LDKKKNTQSNRKLTNRPSTKDKQGITRSLNTVRIAIPDCWQQIVEVFFHSQGRRKLVPASEPCEPT